MSKLTIIKSILFLVFCFFFINVNANSNAEEQKTRKKKKFYVLTYSCNCQPNKDLKKGYYYFISKVSRKNRVELKEVFEKKVKKKYSNYNNLYSIFVHEANSRKEAKAYIKAKRSQFETKTYKLLDVNL